MTTRTVPASVTHSAGDLDASAVWNAGPVASTTFLTNVPLFSGFATTQFTTTTSVAVAIPFAGTVIDTDNGHSNVTNNTRYTAQVSGWYMASGVISWLAGAGNRQVYLAKNGGVIPGSGVTVINNGFLDTVPTGTVLVQLNATDYVEVWGFQDSGGPLNTYTPANQGCYFHVWWVAHA